MDRLRHLSPLAIVAVATIALAACEERAAPAAASGRFASVKADAKASAQAAVKFCDTTLPASGPGAKTFAAPPERAVPGYQPPAQAEKTWRWVNLWATWCKPCVEEMPLLGRWKKTLAEDGLPLEIDLVSIDDDEAALAGWVKKPMPGRVRWLRGQDDLAPLLAGLGVDAGSAIPIHALVDPAGQLRCVRVGAVREGDFAAIRALVAAK